MLGQVALGKCPVALPDKRPLPSLRSPAQSHALPGRVGSMARAIDHATAACRFSRSGTTALNLAWRLLVRGLAVQALLPEVFVDRMRVVQGPLAQMRLAAQAAGSVA